MWKHRECTSLKICNKTSQDSEFCSRLPLLFFIYGSLVHCSSSIFVTDEMCSSIYFTRIQSGGIIYKWNIMHLVEWTLTSAKCERCDPVELWVYLICVCIFRVFLSSARNMQIVSFKIRTCFYFANKKNYANKGIDQTFARKLLGLIIHDLYLLLDNVSSVECIN